ncbi:MAG: CvpA family protein [Verrucomicrobia bacterium]|nr:CvpA family protein [Verrucomicrobiota bacterium]
MNASIIAAFLILWQAVAGYLRGGIRAIANLAALAGAILLAPQLGGLFQPMVASHFTQNPVWERSVAVGIAALAIWLVVSIAGRLVNRITGGNEAGAWSFGFNKKMGLLIGCIQGLVVAFVFLWLMSLLGYASWLFLSLSQPPGRSSPPGGTFASFVVDAKNDLRASMFAKEIGESNLKNLDPVPPKFYSASTLIGVLADAPEKRSRFMRYPDTLRLMSCKAIREAMDDPKANEVVEKGEPLFNLLFVPKVVLIFRDQESRAAMDAFDWERATEFINMRPPARR